MAMLKVVINLLLLALVMVHTSTGAPPRESAPNSYQPKVAPPKEPAPNSYQPKVAPPKEPAPKKPLLPSNLSYMAPLKVDQHKVAPPRGYQRQSWSPTKNDKNYVLAQLELLRKKQSQGGQTVTYGFLTLIQSRPIKPKDLTWAIKQTIKVNQCTNPGIKLQPVDYNAKPQETHQAGYQGWVNKPVANNKNCLKVTEKDCVLTTTTGLPYRLLKIECLTPKHA